MKSTVAVAPLVAGAVAGVVPLEPRSHSYYHGFKDVKYMFTFGDSYTTTGFNASTGPQPSVANPLGNPTYPGYTSSNGPNWVDYLTTTYNESLLFTYNLAYGGATVDSNLVAQYLPTVLDLQQQIQDEFIPIYSKNKTLVPWTSANSLFGIFIGINDVGNSYGSQNSTLNDLIFAEYNDLVQVLYKAGAKNFFFLNVPPVNRSPLTQEAGPSSQALEAADIANFNSRVQSLATNLTKQHQDTTVFLFDTNTLFNEVLDNPKRFPETALYKNTTNYCTSYMNGTPEPNTFYPNCSIPVNEYFFLNSLHPTYPMHDLLAKNVAGMLENGRPL